MPDQEVYVHGLDEVAKKIYGLSQKLGDIVIYKALGVGASVMKKAVIRNAPKGTVAHYIGKKSAGVYVKPGQLRRKGFVVARSKIYRGRLSTDMIGMYLTIAHKKKDDPFYGRFVNDGTRKMRGTHFINTTFENTKQASADAIVQAALAGTELLIRKVGL